MSLFEEDELQKLVVEATPDLEGTVKYRFVTAEQVAGLLSWVPLPAFIVPNAIKKLEQDPWEFVTTEGNIPAPQADLADEMMRQRERLGLGWCITPKSIWSSLCVFRRPDRDGDRTEALATFERWLVENGFPFDRIDEGAVGRS